MMLTMTWICTTATPFPSYSNYENGDPSSAERAIGFMFPENQEPSGNAVLGTIWTLAGQFAHRIDHALRRATLSHRSFGIVEWRVHG